MKKRDFARLVASKVEGLTIGDAEIIVDAVGEAIVDAVSGGDSVRIAPLGSFAPSVTPSRTGIVQFGDRKGERWVSGEKNRIKYTMCSKAHDKLNEE